MNINYPFYGQAYCKIQFRIIKFTLNTNEKKTDCFADNLMARSEEDIEVTELLDMFNASTGSTRQRLPNIRKLNELISHTGSQLIKERVSRLESGKQIKSTIFRVVKSPLSLTIIDS